jgi:hypothetical protein
MKLRDRSATSAFDGTLEDYESETIKKKIKDIIDARYKVLEDRRRDLDAKAKTEINDKCPYMGPPVRR